MAMTFPTHPIRGSWTWPSWHADPASFRVVRAGYDARADELVVRFANSVGKFAIVEPIETPDAHYANVMADYETGAVIGVQIDSLRAAALAHFPHWADAATESDPPPAVIDRLVRDVHDLFVRYGVGGYVWDGHALVRDR